MLTTFERLRVFISSPSDVKEERKITEDIIHKINENCKDTLGIMIEVVKWEKMPPLTPKPSEATIQESINKELKKCNAFILILNRRYGTIEHGYSKSNTEREIDLAINMLKKEERLMFLSYFHEHKKPVDIGPQEKKVIQLKSRLEKEGIWYRKFNNVHDFQNSLTHDLYQTMLKFGLMTRKQEALRLFWNLGSIEHQPHPQLAIIYPPVDRSFMIGIPDRGRFWSQRLAPHVVFEDFKAFQKIEKTLKIINFRNYKYFCKNDIPPNIKDMNRVWVCVPRNRPAINQLKAYAHISQFYFADRKAHEEARIFWRSTIRRSFFMVSSPLSSYLRVQRKSVPDGSDWHPDMAKIIAKDFAVLARFSDKTNKSPALMGKLRDYFFAGMRGLGTWGASWFVDRRYNAFKILDRDDDMPAQFLLEVVYRDGRIVDVTDVSKEPKSYFRRENNISHIKKTIADYNE